MFASCLSSVSDVATTIAIDVVLTVLNLKILVLFTLLVVQINYHSFSNGIVIIDFTGMLLYEY